MSIARGHVLPHSIVAWIGRMDQESFVDSVSENFITRLCSGDGSGQVSSLGSCWGHVKVTPRPVSLWVTLNNDARRRGLCPQVPQGAPPPSGYTESIRKKKKKLDTRNSKKKLCLYNLALLISGCCYSRVATSNTTERILF